MKLVLILACFSSPILGLEIPLPASIPVPTVNLNVCNVVSPQIPPNLWSFDPNNPYYVFAPYYKTCTYTSNDACAAHPYFHNGNYQAYIQYDQVASDPDATAPTPILIQNAGYKPEFHEVITNDGYILSTYRILDSDPLKRPTKSNPRPAVMLQHGLLGAGHDWLLNTKETCLPYMLHEAGFDVFIASNRGTTYSLGHIDPTYNSSLQNQKYWDFSWHEMGIYDVPANIDYILDLTNTTKMFYIGLSEGTTQFFVAMAKNATYNAKIKMAALLAPVAHLGNITNPLLVALAQSQPFANFAFNNVQAQLYENTLLTNVHNGGFGLCSNEFAAEMACANVMFSIGGFNPCQMDCSRLKYYVGHDPDSTAVKNLYHYLQLARSGGFREFDKRPVAFQVGQDCSALAQLDAISPGAPKDYQYDNIKAPILLYSGYNDGLATPPDVNITVNALKKNGNLVQHVQNDFEHLDFYWGIDVHEIFEDIIAHFESSLPL